MLRKLLAITWLLAFVVFCFAGNNDPWLGTEWDSDSPDIDQPLGNAYKELYSIRRGVELRMNKEHETLASSSAGGVHKQGSARAFFQDAAPTTQIDGTAWDSGDTGSLWFDTNSTPDNLAYVLTNHASTGTWTLLSVSLNAELIALTQRWADTQSFDVEILANGGVALGADDDLTGSVSSDINFGAGNFTVAGDTGNTLVGGTLDVGGNIDPTTYETTRGGFLDEDAMGSNAANKVASQRSIKAYVDNTGPNISNNTKTTNTAINQDSWTTIVSTTHTLSLTANKIVIFGTGSVHVSSAHLRRVFEYRITDNGVEKYRIVSESEPLADLMLPFALNFGYSPGDTNSHTYAIQVYSHNTAASTTEDDENKISEASIVIIEGV